MSSLRVHRCADCDPRCPVSGLADALLQQQASSDAWSPAPATEQRRGGGEGAGAETQSQAEAARF